MRIRRNKIIRWQDHISESAWVEKDELQAWADEMLRYFLNETKGDILLETDEYIVIVSEHDGSGSYGNRTIIFKHPKIKISNIH